MLGTMTMAEVNALRELQSHKGIISAGGALPPVSRMLRMCNFTFHMDSLAEIQT